VELCAEKEKLMELICFFCNKSENEVEKIIIYQDKPICMKCISNCDKLISEAMNHFLDEENLQIRDETGILGKYTPSKLSFNDTSQSLILEAIEIIDGYYFSRLFVKRKGEIKYTQLGVPGEGISFSNVISLGNSPFIFFQAFKSNRILYGGGAEKWESFYKADLRDYKIERLIGEGDIVWPKPYIGATPMVFINVSDDGKYLYCNCCLERSEEEIEYFICKLDIATKCLEPITELKGVVF
jgi:hypothetical protein